MMKKIFLSFIAIFLACQSTALGIQQSQPISSEKIVTATKRLYFPDYQGAYNPSIIEFKDGYLLTFRYTPKRWEEPWVSYIGVVLLNESFEPISDPELLDTRFYNQTTPSQSEDARIFSYKNKLYVVYNDNMDLTFPSYWERRDMYMAELFYTDHHFFLSEPVRLLYQARLRQMPWQKNWSPFEWNGNLLFSYSITPHEVISADLETGTCQYFCQTNKSIEWQLGPIRGGTPAQLVDGEYLAFFHSGEISVSPSSDNRELWHYFMGAYTFSADPPFEILKASTKPLNAPEFYTYSSYEKRVIYPGGFVVVGSNAYVAYGKDDSEVWIATINLEALKNSMESVKITLKK